MTQASDIVAELDRLYRASVDRLQTALNRYLTDGTPPAPSSRTDGSFAYPEIRLTYRGGNDRPAPPRSFGRLVDPGEYRISVTKPAIFSDYLIEQLTFLIEDFDVEVDAATGRQEIPFAYVLDPGHALSLDEVSATELARHFPATELAHIGDEIADGLWVSQDGTRPLALFDGLRTDFSLARLRHYTGTPTEHVQQYILFTNYHRYVDEFVRWAVDELNREDSPFEALSAAAGVARELDMKILLAVDGSATTKRMLATLAAHDEMLRGDNQYTALTIVPPVPGRDRVPRRLGSCMPEGAPVERSTPVVSVQRSTPTPHAPVCPGAFASSFSVAMRKAAAAVRFPTRVWSIQSLPRSIVNSMSCMSR